MLGTIFIFVLAAIAGAFFAQSSLLDRAKTTEQKEELLTAKDKATIMIMGVDERSDDVGRSDTLMVATIDPARKEAALLSIPRDTRVAIPRNGYDKINAAYAYGGIDIDVEKRMYYEDPWDDDGGLIIDLRPGMQHMDGKTAVTYVRYRDEEGDIGRVKRQQKFMRACMDAVTTPAILPRLPGIIASVIDSVKTDLSVRQMLEFIGTLKESQAKGLRTEMVPGRPLYINEISYWIPDMGQLRRSMADLLGVTLTANERSRMERAVREYEDSIPADAAEIPAGDTSVGRAVSSDEARSRRDDKDGDEERGRSGTSSERRSGSDRARTGDTNASSPPRSSGTGTSSDTSRRHASTRQNDAPAAQSGRTGGSDGAPTRGGGSAGKQE